MVHLSDLLELLRGILKNSHLLVDSKHCLVSRSILIHCTVDLDWLLIRTVLVILNKSIFNKVIIFCFIPLFRILDLNPIESANSHELITFFLLSLHVLLCLKRVIQVIGIWILHSDVGELLDTFQDDVNKLNVQRRCQEG